MDESSDDEIDLSGIAYTPKEIKQPIKKDVKTMDKPVEKPINLKEKMDKIGKKTNKKQQPTEEEVIDKRRMILLIQFYLLEFPDKLKTFKKINLEKKSYDELKDIKTEIDFTVSNRSTVAQGVAMISTTIQALEFMLLNFTPVNAQGLSRICDDPETIDDMKHICLKHTHLINTEPEARLAFRILTTTLMLHNINSSNFSGGNNNDIIKINSDYVDI